jgi:hypothetical protein
MLLLIIGQFLILTLPARIGIKLLQVPDKTNAVQYSESIGREFRGCGGILRGERRRRAVGMRWWKALILLQLRVLCAQMCHPAILYVVSSGEKRESEYTKTTVAAFAREDTQGVRCR